MYQKAQEAMRIHELLQEAKNPSKTPREPPWEKIMPVTSISALAPPVIIDGLWRQGEVLLLGGHSKSWKSWAQMDLIYCIGNGLPWLIWPAAHKGRVLHIDLELESYAIRERFELIQASYGCGSLDNIDIFALRGHNFSLGNFSEIADHIPLGRYSAISFDPTYRMLCGTGLNESDSGTIIDLMNRSLRMASTLQLGLALLQHFSKGSQNEKDPIDAFSGSGVWGRAPDNCVTFREHQDEKCYTVNSKLRHWPHLEDFVVEFVSPRFVVRDAKDPERLKVRKNGRPPVFSVDALCQLVDDGEYISYANLFRRAQTSNIKKTTFERYLKEAKEKGLLAIQPTDGTYFLSSSYVTKFRTA